MQDAAIWGPWGNLKSYFTGEAFDGQLCKSVWLKVKFATPAIHQHPAVSLRTHHCTMYTYVWCITPHIYCILHGL